VGDKKFTKIITVKPFLLFQPIPSMIAVVAVFMVFVYFAVLGTHIYRGKIAKKKNK
jgi:hypothetical protein